VNGLKRATLCAFGATLVLAWLVLLRPSWLGGSATYIVVRGDSMLPTYSTGDLIVLEAQPAFAVGDVVGYRVPQGEVGSGKIVIHRIVGIEPDGSFSMGGDNNPLPDPWHPQTSDVAGRAVLALPGVGGFIAQLMSPTIAGALAAAIVVMAILARTPAPLNPSKGRAYALLGPSGRGRT